MMRARFAAVLFASGLPAALVVPATAQIVAATSAINDGERLAAVIALDVERQDELDPLAALYRGEDVSIEDLALLYTDTLDRRRLAAAQATLQDLSGIDRARLGTEEQISFDVLQLARRDQAEWLRPDMRALVAVRPLNHFNGLHAEFPAVMARQGAIDYSSTDDYKRALELGTAFARVLDNAIVRFRQGMDAGVTETRLTTGIMIRQIDDLLATPVAESPFYSPVRDFPGTISRPVRSRLRNDFARMAEQEIYPAYRRLRTFLADEYLPSTRERPGLLSMKGGENLYRRMVEHETTVQLDPAAIHREGIAEVTRIRNEMEQVKRELGNDGPLDAFFEILRTDPSYHPRSAHELADGFAKIGTEVDRQVSRFFSHIPRTPIIMAPFPAYRERFEPGGTYRQGSPDGKRSGTFFYNTWDLPSRYITSMATLYLHEASPGHHFQISLAQENTALPPLQRFGGNNAYVEGWALYAETLGYEMGLYRDPMQHWGTLDDEMLRAMRLVVDTGIHAMGWNREQAVSYMLANSGMSRPDAEIEVDRYIANPAQALSYKIGAMTIQRLRAKSAAALGKRFDIREFHDQVLGSGALPLPVLEHKIDRWIDRKIAENRQPAIAAQAK